jgi:hypothetical protein
MNKDRRSPSEYPPFTGNDIVILRLRVEQIPFSCRQESHSYLGISVTTLPLVWPSRNMQSKARRDRQTAALYLYSLHDSCFSQRHRKSPADWTNLQATASNCKLSKNFPLYKHPAIDQMMEIISSCLHKQVQ